MLADVAGPMPRLRSRAPSTSMANLDRLGWVAGMCLDAYGVRVGVRANVPGVLPVLARLMPPGSRRVASPSVDLLYSVWLGESRPRSRGFDLLYSGVERRARTMSREALLEAFETGVRQAIAASWPRHMDDSVARLQWGWRRAGLLAASE